MISVRPAESVADLEAWRQVRIAALPNERTETVEEIRRGQTPDRMLILAELDSDVVGSGIAGRSDLAGQGFLAPRVLPDARRRGVGTALLRALADHVETLGFDQAGTIVDDPGSLAFAERFGFQEVDRDVEQVRTIGDEAWPEIPAGIEVVSVAERPELFTRTYRELAREALQDLAVDRPIEISLDDWEREWVTWHEGSFVALAGGQIVGCAGVHEVYTWTQRGNEAMRAVNEKLGYVTRNVSIRVRGRLPLAR